MTKTYNTPKRSHIVKTRLDDEEHADFLRRLEIYDMNQSEFIREAISGATILSAAKRYFDSKGLKKLPSHKALQTEVEQFIKKKNELYNQYQTAKEEAQRLDTIRHNIEQTLGRKIEHKQEQER